MQMYYVKSQNLATQDYTNPGLKISSLCSVHCGSCRCRLTLSNRHLFSLMAPRQPRKPVTMTTEPKVMTRLAAEREGKEGENVAKLP